MTEHTQEICDCCKQPVPIDPDVQIKGEITLKTGEKKQVSYCKECGMLIMMQVTSLGIATD